jgi:hypothetical protein
MQQEGAFHTDAVGSDTPHGEGGIHTTAVQTDHGTLESLDALALAFNNTDMNADVITGAELRNLRVGFDHLAF